MPTILPREGGDSVLALDNRWHSHSWMQARCRAITVLTAWEAPHAADACCHRCSHPALSHWLPRQGLGKCVQCRPVGQVLCGLKGTPLSKSHLTAKAHSPFLTPHPTFPDTPTFLGAIPTVFQFRWKKRDLQEATGGHSNANLSTLFLPTRAR